MSLCFLSAVLHSICYESNISTKNRDEWVKSSEVTLSYTLKEKCLTVQGPLWLLSLGISIISTTCFGAANAAGWFKCCNPR